MKYVIGVLIPILIQVLFTAVIILANTGNGSWVGLGAFLIAMIAIPVTGLINILVIRNSAGISAGTTLAKCYLGIVIVPVLMILMFKPTGVTH